MSSGELRALAGEKPLFAPDLIACIRDGTQADRRQILAMAYRLRRNLPPGVWPLERRLRVAEVALRGSG